MAERITQAAWDAKRALAKAKAREALSEDAEDEFLGESDDSAGEPQGESGELPYTEWSDEDLLKEFSDRNLEFEEDAEGTREELIEALESDDQSEEE